MIILIFTGGSISGQSLGSFELPQGLGLSNQFKYSYDTEKSIEIFENWFNLDYNRGIFSAGLRFDIFQPNDPNPSISRGKDRYAEIAYKYIKASIGDKREGIVLTVGNYYALFGRGMIVKSYEDRAIRIDNNLLGVKIEAVYAGFNLTALTGMAENASAERKDILHAIDLEYRLARQLRFAGTFATNLPDNDQIARTRMASVRIQPSIWNFDAYAEYGVKMNDDVSNDVFNGSEKIVGKGLYGSLNFYLGSLALVGEYKLYDNYGFLSSDNTIDYNTPPAVRKDYTYILLNRHPSSLNTNNEQGFKFEAIYNYGDNSSISGTYGETKSLGPGSYHQMIVGSNLPAGLQFREIFFQAAHEWNGSLKTIAAFGYNEEASSDTKNFTPILENRLYLDDINTLRVVLEHQHTTDNTTEEQYYDDIILLEYLRSPKFSVAWVSEMQTREPEEGRTVRRVWSFIQFGYKIGGHTDLSLLIGTRQAGNICIGGVCRYEPEFSGVELKMQTRIY